MDKPKLWTKDFVIDSTVNFFVYLVYYIFLVIVAVFAIDNLKATPAQGGLASGLFILAALFSRIVTGRLIEQVGQKKMLYIGIAVYMLVTCLYFKITSLPVLYGVRFLHGAGFGIAATATGTIIANIIPRGRRGEGVSYYAMSATLAYAIGPFLGIYLLDRVKFDIIVDLCVSLTAISCLAVLFLKVPATEMTEEQRNGMKRFALSNYIECAALPISLIGAVLCISYSSVLSFLVPYTREISLYNAGSLFFLVYSIVVLISRPLTGRLFDSKGEKSVMYPAFLTFAIGLVILSQVHHNFVLLFAGGILGFGFGTFVSSCQAIAISASPSHRMGLATSTFFSLADGGAGGGPFFLGFLVPLIGFRGLYLAMAGLALVCMFLYFLLCSRKVGYGFASRRKKILT